jgi:Mor family transcriptional regulator
MSYFKAEEILPSNIIKLIQNYIDGENIYIPRKESNKKEWGSQTLIRQELSDRNSSIYTDYQKGYKVSELAEKYFLSEKSIHRIIREIKNNNQDLSRFI